MFLLLLVIGMSFMCCHANEAYNHYLGTWNMQGAQEGGNSKWTQLNSFVFDNSIYVMALQECGLPPGKY